MRENMSKEVTNSAYRYLGIYACWMRRKQSRATDVYVNSSASRFDYVTACASLIGLRTALFLSRNDFVSVMIARRNSERNAARTFDIRRCRRWLVRFIGVFLTTGVWSMRSIAINDLAAGAPPVLPVLPARPRWIMLFPRKNPASLPVYSRLVLPRTVAPRCCRLIYIGIAVVILVH